MKYTFELFIVFWSYKKLFFNRSSFITPQRQINSDIYKKGKNKVKERINISHESFHLLQHLIMDIMNMKYTLRCS